MTGMYIEVVEEASKYANILSFNPGALLSSYGLEALEKILKRTDILFLNQKEVTLLTGRSCDDGANLLVKMGVPFVVVTLGKGGSKLYTENGIIKSPAIKLESVDTTGAGDSFAAGFVSAFFKQKDLIKCCQARRRDLHLLPVHRHREPPQGAATWCGWRWRIRRWTRSWPPRSVSRSSGSSWSRAPLPGPTGRDQLPDQGTGPGRRCPMSSSTSRCAGCAPNGTGSRPCPPSPTGGKSSSPGTCTPTSTRRSPPPSAARG